MSPLVAIAEGMVARLREVNPAIAGQIDRVYEVVIESEDDLLGLVANEPGVRVLVCTMGKVLTERADRGHDRHGYSFAVVYVARPDETVLTQTRQPGDAAAMRAWVDARISFADENIYRPLAATTFAPVEGAIIEPNGAVIDTVIDTDKLIDFGCFWNEQSFTYTLDESNH